MALAGMIGLLSSSLVMRTRLPVAQPSLVARSLVVCSAGIGDKIQSAVDASNVMVFSKSWCPFCMKTKALFESLDVPYSAMELDELDDGAAIQEELLKMTDQRTVPSVWIGGKHLGGNDGAPSSPAQVQPPHRSRPRAQSPVRRAHNTCTCADTQRAAASGELQKILGL